MKKAAPKDLRTSYVEALVAIAQGGLREGARCRASGARGAPGPPPALFLAGARQLCSSAPGAPPRTRCAGSSRRCPNSVDAQRAAGGDLPAFGPPAAGGRGGRRGAAPRARTTRVLQRLAGEVAGADAATPRRRSEHFERAAEPGEDGRRRARAACAGAPRAGRRGRGRSATSRVSRPPTRRPMQADIALVRRAHVPSRVRQGAGRARERWRRSSPARPSTSCAAT